MSPVQTRRQAIQTKIRIWTMPDGTEVEWSYASVPAEVKADMRRNAIACAQAAEIATGRPQPVEFADGPVGGSSKTSAQGEIDPERRARQAEAIAYVASYSGTWGLPLDIRADRRWGTSHLRLSDGQIEALLKGKAREAGWLAERQSVEDDLHAAAFTAMVTAFVAARQAAVDAPDLQGQKIVDLRHVNPAVEPGLYRRDGVIYKVQIAVHGSGKPYAKRLTNGTFEYAPGAISSLTAEDRMTLDQAEEFGKLYGICCVCSATLTDEKSIARGIGPVCAGRV